MLGCILFHLLYYLCLVFAMEPSALAHWILRSHGMESGGGDLKALGSKRPQFTNEAVKLALQGNVSGFIREYVICGKGHRMSMKEDIAFPVLFAFGPLWSPGRACPGQQSWCWGSTPAVVCSSTLPARPALFCPHFQAHSTPQGPGSCLQGACTGSAKVCSGSFPRICMRALVSLVRTKHGKRGLWVAGFFWLLPHIDVL